MAVANERRRGWLRAGRCEILLVYIRLLSRLFRQRLFCVKINGVLERHYLADDQQASDAVILRMERNTKRTKPVNGL